MTRDFGEVAERLRRSTVEVSGGSGIIWNPDGLILTNAHVARAPRLAVELWDGRKMEATVSARDPRRDLASLRIDGAALPAAEPGDSSALRVGELVIAVGNPLGFTGALSTGVVHALGRNWVRADVRLAPGNSGGPLANARGQVIGINTMIAGGLALAVPSNTVARFLKHGAADAGLGVVVRPVPLEESVGLLVLEVSPGGAAERASLMLGDVLVGAAGQAFRAPGDLSDAIDRGGLLRLQFLRGDRRRVRELTVRLAEANAEAA